MCRHFKRSKWSNVFKLLKQLKQHFKKLNLIFFYFHYQFSRFHLFIPVRWENNRKYTVFLWNREQNFLLFLYLGEHKYSYSLLPTEIWGNRTKASVSVSQLPGDQTVIQGDWSKTSVTQSALTEATLLLDFHGILENQYFCERVE